MTRQAERAGDEYLRAEQTHKAAPKGMRGRTHGVLRLRNFEALVASLPAPVRRRLRRKKRG